jgi:glycosyltransferase involved in cell wall biosynthesis
LSIIGDGEEREHLKHYVKTHELKHVSFLGRKSHDEVMNILMKDIDILINPSFRE